MIQILNLSLSKYSVEIFFIWGRISSKHFEPFWNYYLGRATEVHLPFKDEGPRDIRHDMSMVQDTRKSNLWAYSASDFIFGSLLYFITKCNRYYLKNAAALLLRNATKAYYKMCQVICYKIWSFYYRQLLQNALVLLQNATVITNCNVYYKIHQYQGQIYGCCNIQDGALERWKSLTIITKRSILDDAAILDPSLSTYTNSRLDLGKNKLTTQKSLWIISQNAPFCINRAAAPDIKTNVK